MAFEKRMYPIQTKRKNDKGEYEPSTSAVEGYVFVVQLPESMESIEVGVHKRNVYNKTIKGMAAWCVSDLETGLMICEGDTRKGAVETYLKVYASKHDRLRHRNWGEDYGKMVADFNRLIGVWL